MPLFNPPSSIQSALVAAKRGLGQAKILFVGDSFMEGEGASARANRCLDRLQAGLRSAYSISGTGVGLTPAGPYGTYLSVSSGWRTPATNSGTITPGWFGAQGNTHGRQFDTAGDYVEWTVNGTHADIVYAKSNLGTGDLQVRVDTVLILTIDADTGYSPGEIQRISLGAAGSHTVRITSTGSLALVDGIMVYNGDDTAGVTYWDCTRTQYTNASFKTSLDYQQGWPKFLPHLVVDDLVGTNEYLNNVDGTPAQVQTDLGTRFTTYKGLASRPTVVLLVPLRGSAIGAGANGRGYTWDQYVTVAKAAAASAGVITLDLNDYYSGVSKTGWFDADNLHPSDTGHQKMADALVATVGMNPTFAGSQARLGGGDSSSGFD